MQYTIRKIPRPFDAALRRAERDRKALNQVAVEAVTEGLSAFLEVVPAGRWAICSARDPKAFDLKAALKSQRRVDPKLWR